VSIAQEKELLSHSRAVKRLRARARHVTRHAVRDNELGRVLVAAVMGVVIAFGVAVTREAVGDLHHLLFGVPIEVHLSGAQTVPLWRRVLVPALGGLVYGLVAAALWRWRPGDIVDPIEANALHGGRMSLLDSLRLTAVTVLSAGVGASVGLEAAFTQLGSGTASAIGRLLELRRNDLRVFVGCGAAAAISAAFNAPLAGAFYAFELIIGSYTLATLVPVASAAVTAALITRTLFETQPIFVVFSQVDIVARHYVVLVVIGVLGGLLAIGVMIGVTRVEQFMRGIGLKNWARPALGGLLLGIGALAFPQILGSGHGGILHTIALGPTGHQLPMLVGLILFKAAGSAVSIGSGFRGGLFSSSLFLGTLFGAACALVVARILPGTPSDDLIFVLGGMGAVGAGIVGAPMTMIFLVLEATADFSATMGVTVAVVASALVVRHLFGYSFATWRFHLRGVALQSPHDIGWLLDLQVSKLMRRDFVLVPRTMPLAELRRQFPITESRRVFVVNESGAYQGHVDLVEAHAVEIAEDAAGATGASMVAPTVAPTVASVAHGAAHFLIPSQPVRYALDVFIDSAEEVLAVVDNARDCRVVGYLTESYALRRYYRELETRHREELGAEGLFAPTHSPARQVS
jgi:CIC family chloride channel protein